MSKRTRFFSLPYPEPSDRINVAGDFRTLAEATDETIATKIAEAVADGKKDLESYLTIEDANLTFDDLYNTKADKDYVDEQDDDIRDYIHSLIHLWDLPNKFADTYLQIPDVLGTGYKMSYANWTGDKVTSDRLNKSVHNYGFGYIQRKASTPEGYLMITQQYLEKSTGLDLEALNSFWTEPWDEHSFWTPVYNSIPGSSNAPEPEQAQWHSSGIAVCVKSTAEEAVNIPFDSKASLDNICLGTSKRCFANYDDAERAGIYWSLWGKDDGSGAYHFKRGFVEGDENGDAVFVEDDRSELFVLLCDQSATISVKKIHTVMNRHLGPIALYKTNPAEDGDWDEPGDDGSEALPDFDPDDYVLKSGSTMNGKLTIDKGDVPQNTNSFIIKGYVEQSNGDIEYSTLFKDYRRTNNSKSDYIEFFGGTHSDYGIMNRKYADTRYVKKWTDLGNASYHNAVLEYDTKGKTWRIGVKDGYRNGFFSDDDHGYFAVGTWKESVNRSSLEINTERHEVLIQRGTEGLHEAGYYRDSAAQFKYVNTTTKAKDLKQGEFLINGGNLYFHPKTLDGRALGPNSNSQPTWTGNKNSDTVMTSTIIIQNQYRHTIGIFHLNKFGWGNDTNFYIKCYGEIKWWEKRPENGDIFYMSTPVFGS